MENLFIRQEDEEKLCLLNQAYYSGDWSILAKKGAEGFYFFSDDDKTAIRLSADTRWGKKIIADLKMKVKERRKYPLEVPKEEGGHFHDFFVQNIIFSLLFAGIIRRLTIVLLAIKNGVEINVMTGPGFMKYIC